MLPINKNPFSFRRRNIIKSNSVIINNITEKKTIFSQILYYINLVPIEVWAFIILTFGIAFRLLYPTFLIHWDDFDYARIAKTIEEGRYLPHNYSNWFAMRLPVIFPVAFFIKYLGKAEWVLMAWPFLTSVLSMIFIFYIGTILFNKKAGFWALFLMAIHPMEAKMAVVLLPASIFTFLLLGSLLFFLLGEKMKPNNLSSVFQFYINFNFFSNKNTSAENSLTYSKFSYFLRIFLWMTFWLVSAFFMVNTYYLRPYGLLIMLLPAAYMFFRHRLNGSYIWLPLMVVFIFLIAELILYKVTGIKFFMFEFMKSRLYPDMYPIANVTKHFDYYRNLMMSDREYSMYSFMLIVFLPFYLKNYFKKSNTEKAAIWMPILYFLIFWAYNEFGIFNIEHLTFLLQEDRYLALINPGIILIGGMVFSKKLNENYSAFLSVIFLIFITLVWVSIVGLPKHFTNLSF